MQKSRARKLAIEMLEDRLAPVVGFSADAPIVRRGDSFDGVVKVVATFGKVTESSTGSLLWTGRHILTAGHAVDFNAIQHVALVGGPTGGTFQLSIFGGTATIPFDATADVFRTRLSAIPGLPGNIQVTGGPQPGQPTSWNVEFINGQSVRAIPDMAWNGVGLAGGAAPGVTVATTTPGGIAQNLQVEFNMEHNGVPVNIDYAIPARNITVQPGFDRNPDHGNDIAVLTLPSLAPFRAQKYDLYDPTAGPEIGQLFTVVGYGNTGNGTTGQIIGTSGLKRSALNRFEAGNPAGTTPANGMLTYDFDDGTLANDALVASPANLATHDNGITPLSAEGMSGSGDSGGPDFITDANGHYRIAGVDSYNISPNPPHARPESSFGTRQVVTRVSAFAPFIHSITDVNPATGYNLVLDMGEQVLGRVDPNEKITITARRKGANLEISVSAVSDDPLALPEYYNGVCFSGPAADIHSLTLIGSDSAIAGEVFKNETFVIDGNLGIPSIDVQSSAYKSTLMLTGNNPVPAGGLHFEGPDFCKDVVKIAGNVSTAGLRLDPNVQTVEIDSGALTVAADMSIPDLTLAGGTLQGTGNLTVTDLLSWTAGTMAGAGKTTIPATAKLSISTTNSKALTSRTVDNFGAATWTDSGAIQDLLSVWNNHKGATLDIQGDSSFTLAGEFDNFVGATVTKSAGAGTARINSTFNNAGKVAVSSGTLNLSGGGTSFGSFDVSSGATLLFNGSQYALEKGSTFTGPGVVALGGSTLLADVNVSVPNLALSGGTLDGPGNVTVTKQLTWTAGAMHGAGKTVIPTGATVDIHGPTSKSLQRTLDNSGATTWSDAGDIRVALGTWVNEPASTFTIQGDGYFGPGGTFTNSGTVTKTGGSGKTYIETPFQNNGTVSVKAGELDLGNGEGRGGKFDIAAGATLTLGVGTGTYTLQPAVAVTGAGTVSAAGTLLVNDAKAFGSFAGPIANTATIKLLAGVLDLKGGGTSSGIFDLAAGTVLRVDSAGYTFRKGGAVTGKGTIEVPRGTLAFIDPTTTTLSTNSVSNLNVDGGTVDGQENVAVSGLMTWTGGTLQGKGQTQILAGATLAIAGAADKTLNTHVLTNSGAATWTDGGNIVFVKNAVLENLATGVFDIKSNASCLGTGTGKQVFYNLGVVRKSSAGVQTMGIPFENGANGALFVVAGTMNCAALLSSHPATARVDLSQGASLKINGGNIWRITGAGNVELTGSALALGGCTAGLLQIDAGAFCNTDRAVFTANVVNAGRFNSRQCTIIGNFTQTGTGELDVFINDPAAAPMLMVSGSASLGGLLNVGHYSDFNPPPTTSFEIVSGGSIASRFQSYLGLNVVGGGTLQLDYSDPRAFRLKGAPKP